MPGDMNTRKYIWMVVSAVLILVILLIFTDPWSTLRQDGKRMILHQPGAVDRIELTDAFDTTVLVRKDNRWLLFDREEVNPVAVENLLFAAEKLQINSILNEQAEEGPEGRNIRFYSGNRLMLDYTLFSRNQNYLLRPEGSTRTYYVSVSGYTGLDLGRIFSVASNHYRRHLLIDLLPSDISMIGIELDNGEAFRFDQDSAGNITCSATNADTAVPERSPADLAVRLLFSYFTAIRYEEKSGIMRDENRIRVGNKDMLAKLHVESFRGESYSLQVYPYCTSPGAEPDMFRALIFFNDEPEALIVNYIYLDVLMRDLSHYF